MKYQCWETNNKKLCKHLHKCLHKCLCREFIYTNDTNQNVVIKITMNGTQVFNPYIKVPIPPYFGDTLQVNNNLQVNTFTIKANNTKKIIVCYYCDNWVGNISINNNELLNNFKINKNIQYQQINLNNKKIINNNISNNKNNNISNKCIYNTFVLNQKFNIPIYFGLNMINDDGDTQGLIYQIDENKLFTKKICFSNNNWYTGTEEQYNLVVASVDIDDNTFPKDIYYYSNNFEIERNQNNKIINIADYPFIE
jgi:hypothetical protein